MKQRLTTDANGNVLTQEGTFPFGETWYQSGSGNKWIFSSYQRDSESGLDYALAHYYNSRTGTFCSADPLSNCLAGILAGWLSLPELRLRMILRVKRSSISACAQSASFKGAEMNSFGLTLQNLQRPIAKPKNFSVLSHSAI